MSERLVRLVGPLLMESFDGRKAPICWVNQSLLDKAQQLGVICSFPIICGAVGSVAWGHDVWCFYALVWFCTMLYDTIPNIITRNMQHVVVVRRRRWSKFKERHGAEIPRN
jgi:hypothetical protein